MGTESTRKRDWYRCQTSVFVLNLPEEATAREVWNYFGNKNISKISYFRGKETFTAIGMASFIHIILQKSLMD